MNNARLLNKKFWGLQWAICFLFVALQNTHAQINQMVFGKNRVQYHSYFDEWSQYESENFISYWYGQSQNIGITATQFAELDYAELQRTIEYRVSDKTELIIYTDISDLHQSNIGIDDVFATANNEVKVIGNKVFVYFDGDHTHLRKNIREGVAAVYVNTMLFGSGIQEVVQNAISLNLPSWFKDGLIAYLGEDWNTTLDEKMREIILSKKYKKFSKFHNAEPRLLGQAFFNFIALQYGKANVGNIVYLTRINRDLDDALTYVIGSDSKTLTNACLEYYKKRYQLEFLHAAHVENLPALKVKNKFKVPLLQPKVSVDGKNIAYVLNEDGRWKVYIQNLASGKRYIVAKGGTRNLLQATDYNYPLLAWNPDNQRLFIAYEKHDVRKLLEYNLTTKKKTIDNVLGEFQRLYSIDFMNGKDLVISAAVRGFSDIYLYNTINRNFKHITNDFWDDLDATYVNLNGKRGILFASNRLRDTIDNERLDSILPTSSFDIFFKDLDDTARAITRVLRLPEGNERRPIQIDSTYFSFLSDASGVSNRQYAYLKDQFVRTDTLFHGRNSFKEPVTLIVQQDSIRRFDSTFVVDSSSTHDVYKTVAVVHNSTNLDKNIIDQSASARANVLVEAFVVNGVPRLHVIKPKTDSVVTPDFTVYWTVQQILKNMSKKKKKTNEGLGTIDEKPTVIVKKEENVPIAQPKKESKPKKEYTFESEFDDKPVSHEPLALSHEPSQDSSKQVETSNQQPTVSLQEKAKADSEQEKLKAQSSKLKAQKDENAFTAEDILGSQSEKAKAGDPNAVTKFKTNRIAPYRLKFRNDFYSTKLDNGLLFGGLDSYAGTPLGFTTPPLGILMKANFKDLLEDYQLEGGIRIPTTLTTGYEAYTFFDDRKGQLDKRYALYHKSEGFTESTLGTSNRSARYTTTLGQIEYRYPFDMFSRLQATPTIRYDSYTPLATDRVSLDSNAIDEERVGLKLEYVYDNTRDIDNNIKNGTRYKVWIDASKRFNLNLTDKLSFSLGDNFLGIFGFDARHYQRILKHSVLALRTAGALSFGSEKTLFVLGGVDNQINASYNSDITTPPGNYAFQTLSANMRGFDRNIRNGTSYALINAELRVPIFQYLSDHPLNSSFWRNAMVVGFVDLGTAWHGANPFRRENPLNTITKPDLPDRNNAPVVITINYYKDPVVFGYGVGGRIFLFGYTLRADYGWGVETRTVQKPMWHFALGTDF